jgi:cytoskeletal protein RodZ
MTKQKATDSQDPEKILEEQHSDQESEKLPIGQLFRQLREKKALKINDISRETKISSSNLISIEQGNYNELPADTFIRGQIIIYADFLGLDGAEAAHLFFEERAQCTAEEEKKHFSQQSLGLSTKELAEPAHISSAAWAISLFLLIITFLAVFSWYTDWTPFAYFFEQKTALISTKTVNESISSGQEHKEVRAFPLASTNTSEQAHTDSSGIEQTSQEATQLPKKDTETIEPSNTTPE